MLLYPIQGNLLARRICSLLLFCIFFTVIGRAQQSAAFSCQTDSDSPLLRAGGRSELLGEFRLNCSGGAGVYTTDLDLYLSANYTGRILDTSTLKTEALLIVGDPATPVLGQTAFQGILIAPNRLQFPAVKLPGPGSGKLVVRIVNLRADTAGVYTGNLGVPAQILAFLSSANVPFGNPQRALGFVEIGFNVLVNVGGGPPQHSIDLNSNGTPVINVQFREYGAAAFRKRNVATTAADPAALGPQAEYGIDYGTESGFYLPALGFGEAGLATSGTRLMFTITNIPAGVTLAATVAPTTGGTSSVRARLIATAADGSGTFLPEPADGSGLAPLPVTGGTARAVWEVLSSDPAVIESVGFAIYAYGTATTGGVAGFKAQLAPVNATSTADASSPNPRFTPVTPSIESTCGVECMIVPSFISLRYTIGDPAPARIPLNFRTTGLSRLNWRSSISYVDASLNDAQATDKRWLAMDVNGNSFLQVDPTGLSAGKYYALVHFNAGYPTAQTFVVLDVRQPPGTPVQPKCTVESGLPALARGTGVTERLADLVLNCDPAAPAASDVRVTLNTPVTSRPNDVLLLLNEPQPFEQSFGSNVFRATRLSDTQFAFSGVPLPASRNNILRITNIFADASRLPIGQNAPGQVLARVRMSPVSINTGDQTLALIQPGYSFSLLGAGDAVAPGLASAGNGKLRFTEATANSFKIRNRGTTWQQPGNLLDQSIPGAIYNAETGFYNPGLPADGGIAMGLASQGTRLVARFTNIPAGTAISVAVNETGAAPGSPKAQLVQTDGNGAGAYQALSGTGSPAYQSIPVTNGVAVAVWEYVDSSGLGVFAKETLDFGFQITGSVPSNAAVEGFLGPLSTTNVADAAAPLPRFQLASAPNPVCVNFPCLRAPASITLTESSNSQTFTLTSDADPAAFLVSPPTVSWLRVTPISGNTPAQITVYVDPIGLTPGVYTTNVVIGSLTIPVTYTATSSAPNGWIVSRNRLQFAFESGVNPPPQSVALMGNPGLSWTASADVPWLQFPTAGTTPGEFPININAAMLPAGEYEGVIWFLPSSQSILVVAKVTPSGSRFSITGRVSGPKNVSRPGITVTLSGAISATATTAADGSYAFSVPAGSGPYTVTPSGGGYTFTPPSVGFATINASQTANFSGITEGVGPVLAGVSPAEATGNTATFSINARHPDGVANIYRIYFQIGTSTSTLVNGCHGFYDRATRSISLYDDSLTSLKGPLVTSSAGVMENSNCSIGGLYFYSVPDTATNAGFNMGVSRKGRYGSTTLKLYVWVQADDGKNTGWIESAVWTPAAAMPPTLATAYEAVEAHGFTIRATDPNNDLSRAYFLVSPTPEVTVNSCHGFYDYPSGQLLLYNDSLTGFVTENSTCAIDTANSGIGDYDRVTIGLSRKGPLRASRVYVWLTDLSNLGTGWLDTGLNTAARTNQPPVLSEESPATANAPSQAFSATISDPDGRYDINRVYFLVNPSPAIPQNTCHGFYDRQTNAVYLYNDTLTAVATGTPENSQCRVTSFTAAPVDKSGTGLRLSLTFDRKGNYTNAPENVYLWPVDFAGNGTGWVQVSSWTNSNNSPPTVVAPAPPAMMGGSRTFTMTARDGDGAADIKRLYFLFNTTPNIPQNTCHGFYDRTVNQIFLYRDGLNGLAGPLAPGAAAVLENSQCTIFGRDTSVTAGGTDVTLNLTVTLKTAAANAYLWAVDTKDAGTGWVRTASWTANGNSPPAIGPQTITSISGTNLITLTFSATDADGAGDIQRLYFLINSDTSIPQNTCHGFYERATNSVFLYNDQLTGPSAALENSQCRIDPSFLQTGKSFDGGTLFVTLKLQMKLPYIAQPRSIYLWARDSQNADTGWVRVGSWVEKMQSSPYLSTTNSNGIYGPATQTIDMRMSDPDGQADISRIYFLVADSPNVAAGGCHGFYDRAAVGFFLYNDALTSLVGPGSATNTQCSLSYAQSFPPPGVELSITWSFRLTLNPAFIGKGKNIYVWVVDAEGNGTGWQQIGQWNPVGSVVNFPPDVYGASATPRVGSPQTFETYVKDANGYVDVSRIYFLVNSTASAVPGSCHGFYDRTKNQFFLYNDSFSALLGPLTPGGQAVLENGLCAINGAVSRVVSSSEDRMVLNIGLSLKAPFANTPRKVYFLSQDQQNADSGWVQIATWN